jgi:2-dehydro-3-deoxyphosphooctonate aldolase (KDO 8-P synthase)
MGDRMLLIAGPCVIEDEGIVQEIAAELARQLEGLPIELYFKASFDKANRTSIDGFRGPGMSEGLKLLERVRARTGLKLMTDFHLPEQARPVAEVVDFIQIPAFLCRQTDMIVAGAEAALERGRRLNVKKGQFLAPWDAKNIVEKVRAAQVLALSRKGLSPAREDWFTLTERGVSFGYNTLVVDMISFQCMQSNRVPVIYDATHSIQMPGAGAGGKSTGGKREYLETLARAAMAAGADGIFMECHPRPDEAKSDGPNAFHLEHVGAFIRQLLAIRALVRSQPKLLPV